MVMMGQIENILYILLPTEFILFWNRIIEKVSNII